MSERRRTSDELGHDHDHPSHRQGEGHNPQGDEAITRQRVAREADKHRNPADDPAEKEEAENRHSAARDRVLAADYAGQDEANPEEVSEVQKEAEARVRSEQDKVARQRAAARQRKR